VKKSESKEVMEADRTENTVEFATVCIAPSDKVENARVATSEPKQRTIQGRNNGTLTPRPWKKGQSGNPSGRRLGALSLTPELKLKLGQICPTDKKKRIWREVVVENLLKQATKGNGNALKEIFERIEGKVPRNVALDVASQVSSMSDAELECMVRRMIDTELEE
jgi:hypothetical protein